MADEGEVDNEELQEKRIDLLAPGGRKVRLSIEEKLTVTPKTEFLNDMEALVGTGNVKFVTK